MHFHGRRSHDKSGGDKDIRVLLTAEPVGAEGAHREHRRGEALGGGFGGPPPRKFWNIELISCILGVFGTQMEVLMMGFLVVINY